MEWSSSAVGIGQKGVTVVVDCIKYLLNVIFRAKRIYETLPMSSITLQCARGWQAFSKRKIIPQGVRRARICKFSCQKVVFYKLFAILVVFDCNSVCDVLRTARLSLKALRKQD